MGEVLIKGGHGGRIEARKGQIIEIINIDGQQICDFFAFNMADLGETLSPGHTRSGLRRIVLKVGDVLVSCYRNPMFEILEDTCGQHDVTFPPCDPTVYERLVTILDGASRSRLLRGLLRGLGDRDRAGSEGGE